MTVISKVQSMENKNEVDFVNFMENSYSYESYILSNQAKLKR